MNGESAQFDVRFIDLEAHRVETRAFDLDPKMEEAAKVCGLFAEFMKGQPREFRTRVPFLKRGEWELEWSAAEGGVAFVVFHESGDPITLGVLVSGMDEYAAEGMVDGFRNSVLGSMLEHFSAEDQERALGGSGSRLIMTAVPGRPELLPTSHLLNTSLASVFFRSLRSSGQA